jgi:hypothetical protein
MRPCLGRYTGRGSGDCTADREPKDGARRSMSRSLCNGPVPRSSRGDVGDTGCIRLRTVAAHIFCEIEPPEALSYWSSATITSRVRATHPQRSRFSEIKWNSISVSWLFLVVRAFLAGGREHAPDLAAGREDLQRAATYAPILAMADKLAQIVTTEVDSGGGQCPWTTSSSA